jgi:MFS family permease
MFLVSCVTEIFGYLIPIFGGKYSDRNRLCLALLISGFSSLVTAIIPVDATPDLTFNKISTVFFAGMGKMFISTSLYLLYVYPTKIFPTSVRNTLVSYILCSGRLGAIIAPQVNLLRIVVWEPLPYYVFGLNTIFASSLLLFLPNEKNIKHSI